MRSLAMLKNRSLTVAALLGCCFALSAETIVIRNVDVYPVNGAEIKGASVVIENGRIAEIGVKIIPAKGARIIEGKNVHISLNGYPTSAPLGKRAREAELSYYISMGSEAVLHAIEEEIERHFSAKI